MKAKGNFTDGVDARGGMRRDKPSFLNSLSIYFLHSSVGGHRQIPGYTFQKVHHYFVQKIRLCKWI